MLVLGDLLEDKSWFGSVTRLCPEAPIPIVDVERDAHSAGGAGNVARNVEALGKRVRGLLWSATSDTKHRLFVGDRLVARWDQKGVPSELPVASINWTGVDRVIIADYAKGTITPELIAAVWQRRLPTFVDTKQNPTPYLGWATAVLPNAAEYAQFREVYDLFDLCVVTEGANGLSVRRCGELMEAHPAFCAHPRSVIGAGDTVTAAFAVSWPRPDAALIASAAAAIAVAKPPIGVATAAEVEEWMRKYGC